MWTEAIKNFAEHGKGNVIFLDGSTEGMEKTLKQLMAIGNININPNNGSANKK
jgi:prepilin-type processing-associated H-X9-DG protein